MDKTLQFLTKDLVTQAAHQIDKSGIPPKREGTGYVVLIDDKEYPFKLLVTEAAKLQGEDIKPDDFPSNEANRKGFEEITGFKIVPLKNEAVKDLIKRYKSHISQHGLSDEQYKWELLAKYKGKPDFDAPNLLTEIKSIDFKNLIYPVGVSVAWHIAIDREEQYKECFKQLFDESMPLIERIKVFNEKTLEIYRELNPNEKESHHQDERTMATYLTYYDPDRYTLYKNSFYVKYCRLLEINHVKQKNEKYIHYLSLIEDLIEDYIKPDDELISLFRNSLPDEAYQDPNYKILAQDILYTCLDQRIGIDRQYWRIGTTDGTHSYWELMREENKVSIGWPDLGDLNDIQVNEKKDIDKLLKETGHYIDKNSIRSRKAGEIFNFYQQMSVGDVVLAQDGGKILGIGLITDEYVFNSEDDFAHQRNVNWQIINPVLINNEGLRTTVFEINDQNTIRLIDNLLNEEKRKMKKYIEILEHKKQIILQGPPGSGKTYTAKDLAEKMIFNEVSDDKKAQKRRLETSEQFELVQFHPSYSYEDFVRGITAKSTRDGNISYQTEDKILAVFANEAKKNLKQFNEEWVGNKFDLFIDTIRKTEPGIVGNHFQLENNYYVGPITDQKIGIFFDLINTADNAASLKMYPLFRIKKGCVNGIIFDDKVELSTLREKDTLTLQNEDTYALFKKFRSFLIDHYRQEEKNYILIIDEINRANLPSVLGELIYALEYRGEAVASMYSIDGDASITIPENLYIIGTMNTADRSVGHIDYAIKRRFAFVDVAPSAEVIKHVKAKELFKLVEALFVKVDGDSKSSSEHLASDFDFKDVQLGHSYFMAKDAQELKLKLQYEIVPILNEYVKDGLLLESAKEEINKIANFEC